MKIRIPLVLLMCMAGLVILTGCDSSKPKIPAAESVESLTISTVNLSHSSLIWLAKGRGYFSQEGLAVQIKSHDTGQAAAEEFLEGNADLSTASEQVVAKKIIDRPDLRIIANLEQCNDIKFVGRKDRGINRMSDIYNKRVGLRKNTTADYYLYVFSVLNDIPFQNVQTIDLTPSDQVKAIIKGEIDACIVWEPFATQAKNELGDNACIQPAQSGYGHSWLLFSTAKIIKDRSGAIHRFVSALESADEFLKNHRNEAEQIVASQLGPTYASWNDHDFGLELDRSLIISLENQFKWQLQKKATDSKIPNFLDFIYFDALKEVNPQKIKMMY